jgi:hypothetical protein
LPPSQVATPLPVTPSARRKGPTPRPGASARVTKRKRAKGRDGDAPRAFKRLMALANGQKLPSGLDDGKARPSKKRKSGDGGPAKSPEEEASALPTIKPGEKLSDFSARVDAALPLGGLINWTAKQGKDPLGHKVHRTKTEKKLHKLYDQWRDEEKKIQARREEELELAEERELDNEVLGVKVGIDLERQASGRKKSRRRSKYLGEMGDAEGDPWEELKKRRGEERIGLHDVAQAPPQLEKLTRGKLAIRGAGTVDIDSVPKAAGSLRQREGLQVVRQGVIESYRALMKAKRRGPHA